MRTFAPLLLVFLAAACGMAPSEDERALDVARAFLRATDTGRVDRAWELISIRHRAFWEEIRDAMAGEPRSGSLREFAEHFRGCVPRGDGVPVSGRELYLLVAKERRPGFPHDWGDWDRPVISRDGDLAVVRYANRGLAIGLRREDGHWRIDAHGSNEVGGVLVQRMESGREVAFWGWADLGQKEIERVPLPDVAGGGKPEYGEQDLRTRVLVHEDGRYEVKGRTYSPTEILDRLQIYAERKMDLEDPEQPSVVPLHLSAHRGAPWPAVRRLLEACAHPEVRIRFVTFVTWEGDWGEIEGFHIALRRTAPGIRPPTDAVRIQLPDDMKWEEALRIFAGIERKTLLGSLRIDPL